MFVSAIIFHDQMQVDSGWSLDVYLVEKSGKFLMPMTRHTVADIFAVEHAKGRKQSGVPFRL